MQLARDRSNKELVAIKFMKRGETISKCVFGTADSSEPQLSLQIWRVGDVLLWI